MGHGRARRDGTVGFAVTFRILIADDADPRAVAKRGATRIQQIIAWWGDWPTMLEVEHHLRWFGALEPGWRVVLVVPL